MQTEMASGNANPSIVIGTPGFMPTEQSIGRQVFSSDIYSLGLTAIYLLTGRMPQQLACDNTTGETLLAGFCSSCQSWFCGCVWIGRLEERQAIAIRVSNKCW